MLLSESNHQAIQTVVESVYAKAKQIPGLILTEGDLKCHLFLELAKSPEFSSPVQTQENHILATPLHTEVSWFDKDEKLTIKPDITILSPEHLSIIYERHTCKLPPRKQFSFDGQAFIFELKFIRSWSGFTSSKLDEVKKDFQKIKSLFDRLHGIRAANDTFCYFIVFSRYRCTNPDWNNFFRENDKHEHWRCIYRSLDVPLPEYET